eukprot:1408197-Rhodomonas_salina.1
MPSQLLRLAPALFPSLPAGGPQRPRRSGWEWGVLQASAGWTQHGVLAAVQPAQPVCPGCAPAAKQSPRPLAARGAVAGGWEGPCGLGADQARGLADERALALRLHRRPGSAQRHGRACRAGCERERGLGCAAHERGPGSVCGAEMCGSCTAGAGGPGRPRRPLHHRRHAARHGLLSGPFRTRWSLGAGGWARPAQGNRSAPDAVVAL